MYCFVGAVFLPPVFVAVFGAVFVAVFCYSNFIDGDFLHGCVLVLVSPNHYETRFLYIFIYVCYIDYSTHNKKHLLTG